MNLKPNLWTVLFLLAAAVSAYQYFGTPQPKSPNPTPAEEKEALVLSQEMQGQLFQLALPRDVVRQQIESYSLLANQFALQQQRGNLSGTVENICVKYFKLNDNLMHTMVALTEGVDVYAIPVLQQMDNGKVMIDLVFSDTNPNASNFNAEARVFDFSKPCPTLCDQTCAIQ